MGGARSWAVAFVVLALAIAVPAEAVGAEGVPVGHDNAANIYATII